MNAYELRNHFTLGDFNTSISREAFEAAFTKTKESVRFTFNGWDGKAITEKAETPESSAAT
jgi:hypothetical protein